MNLELINIEIESFFLRNRTTKKQVPVTFIKDSINGIYKLNIKEISFSEKGFYRFDLICKDRNGILYRPIIEAGNLDYSSINLGKSHFSVGNNEWVNFYITKDHEFSFVKGDLNKVLENSFKVKELDTEAEILSYEKGILQLSFFHEKEIDSFQFYIKNKKNNQALKIINVEIINGKTNYFIAIDEEKINRENNYLYITYTIGKIMINASICGEKKILQEDTQFNDSVFMVIDNKKNRIIFTKEIKKYLENFGEVKTEFIKANYLFVNNATTLETDRFLFEQDDVFLIENTTKKTYSKLSNIHVTKEKIWQEINAVPIEKLELNDKMRLIMLRVSKEENEEELEYEEKKTFTLYRFNSVKDKRKLSNFEKREDKAYIPSNPEMFLSPYWSINNELIFQLLDEAEYKNMIFDKIEKRISIKNISFFKNEFHFMVEDINVGKAKKLNFYMLERSKKEKQFLPHYKQTDDTFVVDFTDFANITAATGDVSRWDMYITAEYANSIEFGKIGCYTSKLEKKISRYFDCFNLEEASSNSIIPYLTAKNEVSIICNTETKINNEQISYDIYIEKSSVKNEKILIQAVFQLKMDEQYDIADGLLKLRNKAMNLEYPIVVNKINKINDKVKFEIEINSNDFRFIPFYWDIFINIVIGEKVFPIKLKKPSESVKKNISNKIINNEIYLNDDYMLYPYITMDNSYSLCFRKREGYETRKYKIMEIIAYYYYVVLKRYYERKDIWLGFEKGSNGAQDNGYNFFDYCYHNNKHKNFYYIMKEDSNDWDVVKNQKDKVIKFMSFKYMVYMYAAKLLISSESKGHIYDIRIQKGKLKENLNNKKIVFLQHGVTALKRVDYVFKKTKTNAVNLFIVTSNYEKEIIKQYFGYEDDEIVVTGFSRWDLLEDKSQNKNIKSKIFMMPTWRAWMDGIPKEDFLETDYYKNYKVLLESEQLKIMLELNNAELHFLLHPKFLEFSNEFISNNDNITIHTFGDIRVNEYLMESSLLITDYSSVAWDMYYQKKPVIFYQFDVEQYNKYQGSYMDFEKDLFGDIAYNENQLLDSINYYLVNEFREKQQFAEKRSIYFAYNDKKNSERIFSAIKNNKKLHVKDNKNIHLSLKKVISLKKIVSQAQSIKYKKLKSNNLI